MDLKAAGQSALVILSAFTAACEREPDRGSNAQIAQAPASGPISDSVTVMCTPPDSSASGTLASLQPLDLEGRYRLTAIARHEGVGADSIAIGTLTLQRSVTSAAEGRGVLSYPVIGNSDIDLTKFGHVSLVYSPASTSQDRPGVELGYSAQEKYFGLVFGNARSTGGGRVDAGVEFVIHHAHDGGFGGTWVDGGRRRPVARGYFCARRLVA